MSRSINDFGVLRPEDKVSVFVRSLSAMRFHTCFSSNVKHWHQIRKMSETICAGVLLSVIKFGDGSLVGNLNLAFTVGETV